MDLAEDGIYYFQTYYQILLLIAVSLAMVGWMFSLYQQLDIDKSDSKAIQDISTKSLLNSLALIALLVLFIYGISSYNLCDTYFPQKFFGISISFRFCSSRHVFCQRCISHSTGVLLVPGKNIQHVSAIDQIRYFNLDWRH